MGHHPLPANDFAHACHGLVDGPGTRIHDKAPHLQTDLIAGKNSSGMGVKIVEQRPFARLESHAMIWVHVWRNVVMEITCVICRTLERRSNTDFRSRSFLPWRQVADENRARMANAQLALIAAP